MANWKITKDRFAAEIEGRSAVGVGSVGIDQIDEKTLTEKFRLLDDDGVIYFDGVSDDSTSQNAFDPLDDFGQLDSGCTEIQYFNKETRRYETL
ncbi:MAG TPA: hypothetical protein VK308_03665 [Pyrinomonadaceae bacterium]|nr:hypothetical protein [Pyrinomonadaceae bacterium]